MFVVKNEKFYHNLLMDWDQIGKHLEKLPLFQTKETAG